MTVKELAIDLRCSSDDIRRTARELDINTTPTPTHALKPDEVTKIRARGPISREDIQASRQQTIEPNPTHENKRARLAALAPPQRQTEPAQPSGNPSFSVVIHEGLYERMTSSVDARLRKRLQLVIRQLFSRGRPNHIKPVEGIGKGWHRTSLGGKGGNQFYLWWTTSGAPPVAGLPINKNQLLLRVVRHHDETDVALSPGDPTRWAPFLPSEVAFMLQDETFPFRQEQTTAAAGTGIVKFINVARF